MKVGNKVSSIAAGAFALLLVGSAALAADPPGCQGNSFNSFTIADKEFTPNGGLVNWSGSVFVSVPGTCTETDVTIKLCCPEKGTGTFPLFDDECGAQDPNLPTGTFQGCCKTQLTGQIVRQGDPAIAVGPLSCLVDVDPGVTAAVGGIRARGTLQSDPPVFGSETDLDDPVQLQPCEVEIDKQVCCKAGAPATCSEDDTDWKDVGFDDSIAELCTGIEGAQVAVRYKLLNPVNSNPNVPATTLRDCVITESNAVIGGSVTDIGSVCPDQASQQCIPAGGTFVSTIRDPICNDALEAGEADTATVTCFCTPELDVDFTATDSDMADITCLAPAVTITKTCSAEADCVNTASITVTNTGQVALTGCQITDLVYEGSSECTGTADRTITPPPFDLAIGANNIVAIPLNLLPVGNSCDAASVVCNVVGDGTTSDGPAEAICNVVPPDCSITKDCADQVGTTNAVQITLTNAGQKALNCGVVDTVRVGDSTEPCDTGTSVEILNVSNQAVAVGQTATFNANASDLTVTSCNGVTGTCASATCAQRTDTCTDSDICVVTTTTTSTSSTTSSSTTTSTSSTTSTTAPPEGGCRVTGGGRIYNGPTLECDPDTAEDNCLFPQADDATHGGQVGASVGVATPYDEGGDEIGSDCIKGEWEHVRHIRPRLRGNFHASHFDSLMCGCLGCLTEGGTGTECADPITGEWISCGEAFSADGLCNPEQPGQNFKENRICGPEPRKAPANKICFSGLGDYNFSNGKRTRLGVVFRVDIIDRSEPGGGFPGGSIDPPDRYRMRMWFLCDPANPDVCVDPRSAEAKTLRQGVACSDPAVETLSVRTPDIDDGGDLDRGNHQLHPPTGATCSE